MGQILYIYDQAFIHSILGKDYENDPSTISVILLLFLACQEGVPSITGTYTLAVVKNTSTGELEILGEPDDYFGKITFFSSRERVYEPGLQYQGNDSLHFILPGGGGFLALKKNEPGWKGRSKYFGIQANVQAQRTGDPSSEMQALVSLKPLGQDVISTAQEESFPSYDAVQQRLYFCRDQKIYVSQQEVAGPDFRVDVRRYIIRLVAG